MIHFDNGIFRLETVKSSCWFRITKFGHLESVYYGRKLEHQEIEPLLVKRTAQVGSCIAYDESDPLYVLDNIPLQWSGNGRGDYRYCPAEIRMPDLSFTHDFTYVEHELINGIVPMETLPGALDGNEDAQTLRIITRDENEVMLTLYYTVFPAYDVITRRVVITNCSDKPLEIRRLMSMSLDIPDRGYKMLTLDGSWIKEAHLHEKDISYGMYVNESNTGASSNRHNPGFLLAEQDAGQDRGDVFGFNLIYSGNHFGFVQKSHLDLIRIGIGMNPHCFSWDMKKGDSLETPEAVLCFSEEGYNGFSARMHDFVNNCIVRGEWKNKERPVLINNWEAHFFDFTRRKLLKLAKQAKKLGIELFVLDDGWFGKRNNDTAGLGDYWVNTRKLPGGIGKFADKIRKLGLEFGLWFEPEMVNEDSDLFRQHPDWVVKEPDRKPVLGRNQLVLDLCRKEVRDYIVENMGRVLDEAKASYVKWDMNRHISAAYSPALQNQGEFYHRYILGLYDILHRIFDPRPHILLESCSSGGNRFDLGMLCYSPQIWASDNTDPVVRQRIQGGLSLFYPLSAMGAHVSQAPHQQTLRSTPLSTRFNTACFGVLGYELDLKYLSYVEKKEIAEQIAFYKKYRRVFQFGRFHRTEALKDNQLFWQCMYEDTTVTGLFQQLARTADGHTILKIPGLKEDAWYTVETRAQRLYVRRFGALVKHILPVELNPEGLILRNANKYYALTDCVEHYQGYGRLLSQGIFLNNQFMGSYYNSNTELLGDFGSYLFITTKQKEEVSA